MRRMSHAPIDAAITTTTDGAASTIASLDDIRSLVHAFYARVRQDPLLGPVFEAHVHDWDEHLQTLVGFWSWLVLRQEGFSGAPMPRHARLPRLSWAHFERWLALWRQTTAELQQPLLQALVDGMAGRIAVRLWEHYQKQAPQGRWLHAMPQGLESYRLSPMFTHETLPAALQAAHTTKAGTWGLLRVHGGALVFTLDLQPPCTILLKAGDQLVIEPQVPHHVVFVEPGSCQIAFWRASAKS